MTRRIEFRYLWLVPYCDEAIRQGNHPDHGGWCIHLPNGEHQGRTTGCQSHIFRRSMGRYPAGQAAFKSFLWLMIERPERGYLATDKYPRLPGWPKRYFLIMRTAQDCRAVWPNGVPFSSLMRTCKGVRRSPTGDVIKWEYAPLKPYLQTNGLPVDVHNFFAQTALKRRVTYVGMAITEAAEITHQFASSVISKWRARIHAAAQREKRDAV